MMKKLILFALMVTMLPLTSCKKENNSPAPPPIDPPATIELTKAFGMLGPVDAKNGIQLVISNFEADFIEEFTGKGEFISLIIDTPGTVETSGRLNIPAGSYAFESGTQAIRKSADSFFAAQNDEGERIIHPLSAGTISIVKVADNYTITGEVTGDKDAVFKFSFTGVVGVDPGKGIQKMTNVAVCYENKFIKELKFAYTLAFTNTSGQMVGLNICTAPSDYFKNIPAGTYLYSASKTDAGTILKSEASYYTLINGGTRYPIEEGTVTFAKTEHGYAVTGVVSAVGKRGLEFSFEGALPVEKATLVFEDGELNVAGQHTAFTCFEYYLSGNVGKMKPLGDKIGILFGGPIDYYNQYLPMKTGTYTVNSEPQPTPFTVLTHSWLTTNAGIHFADDQGEATQYYYKTGSVELTTSSLSDDTYTFGLSGKLDVEAEDGDHLIVDLSWTGTLKREEFDAGYWYTDFTHPWSMLESDFVKNDFVRGVYDGGFSPGSWSYAGGPEDGQYIQLYLVGENAIFYEWFYEDIWNANHYFMTIGLNLKEEMLDGNIPTGTYKYDKDWTFAPGTFMPGNYMNGVANITLGCSIFNGSHTKEIPLGCGPNDDGGEIVISKAGNLYTIAVNGFDDLGHKVTVNFTGEFTNIDDEVEPDYAPAMLPDNNMRAISERLQRRAHSARR